MGREKDTADNDALLAGGGQLFINSMKCGFVLLSSCAQHCVLDRVCVI